MDPYIKPVLLSSLIVLLFNTIIFIPILSTPIISYFYGGIIAVVLFHTDLKKEANQIIKFSDAAILSIGTGLLVGGVLSLLFALKMQDAEFEGELIRLINQSTQMHASIPPIDKLDSLFLIITAIFTAAVSAITSFLGGIITLPFIQKKKR